MTEEQSERQAAEAATKAMRGVIEMALNMPQPQSTIAMMDLMELSLNSVLEMERVNMEGQEPGWKVAAQIILEDVVRIRQELKSATLLSIYEGAMPDMDSQAGIAEYHGHRLQPDSGGSTGVGRVQVHRVEPDGSKHDLPHIARHSPDGFEWGYAGSGPADLALALLADVMKAEPSPAMYQAFKSTIVEHIPRDHDWMLSQESIRVWIEGYREAHK